MVQLLVLPALFLGFFAQGVTGFASALVSMPLLVELVGLRTASPAFAVIALTVQGVMMIRYRQSLHFRPLLPLMLGAAVAIPIGVIVLRTVPEHIILTVIGIFVLGYALYALLGPRLPEVKRRRWAFGFGVWSGLLSGAYNAGGPPYVIYGTMSRWTPTEFKGNMQALFLVNTFTLTTTHILAHSYTTHVLQYVLLGLPAVLLGLFVGFSFDRFLNPERFRRLILVLLIFLALRMIF